MAELDADNDVCPTCGSAAKIYTTARDAMFIDCQRCGSYQISRAALVMATARRHGERERARASYGLRHHAADERTGRVIVDSTNIETLFATKLPAIGAQVTNLLRWIADELGDDHLGWAELPAHYDNLAGVIGTIDGDRVETLIAYAEQERLVRTMPDSGIGLTPAGWRRLEEPAAPAAVPEPARMKEPTLTNVVSEAPGSEIVRAHCPNCGPDRRAAIVARHGQHDDDPDSGTWSDVEYRILKCRGCETLFIEKTLLFSESFEVLANEDTGEWEQIPRPTISYWPAPSRRRQPEWVYQIADHTISRLMVEVYDALNSDLRTLAAMGIRAILDRSFVMAGAPEHGNFTDKLAFLAKAGAIGDEERQRLAVATDAGNAAAHRGWRPEVEELDGILDAAEHFLKALVVLKAQAAKVQASVPPRPARPPASQK